MRPSALLATLMYLGSWSLQVQAQESPLIRRIQDISMSSLEPGAPNVALSKWLAQLSGLSASNLDWEVNDCGEGGDGRQAPTCVEGRFTFSPGMSAGVSVAVATTEGKTGGRPSIVMMYVKDG